MKKVVVFISVVIVFAFVTVSCRSTKCAAYGEVEKYQKEVKY